MKYNGFYFALFRGTMKKVLAEHYGKEFARDTMKNAHSLYKRLVRGEIGLQHGVLHRQQTIASGGAYCDYFITGDREDTHGSIS